uniref:WSC domain-containing protein n=2 Tax=Macrostomum lignano TaxID=282301 RepID=A0A1I8GNZ2_9PLAT
MPQVLQLTVFFCALLTCVICKMVNHTYVGCYVDYTDHARDLTALSGVTQLGPFKVHSTDPVIYSTSMSLELCSSACSLGGFSYFGVQVGLQCFCGNSYGSQGKGNEGDCKRECTGNPLQTCGGPNRNSVFYLSYTNFKNLYTVVKSNSLIIKTDSSRTSSWPTAAQTDADCLLRCSARADCQAAVFSQRLLACHLLAFAYPPASLTGPDWTLYQRD